MKIRCLVLLLITILYSCNHPESKEFENNTTINSVMNEEVENTSSFFFVTKVIDGDTFFCVNDKKEEFKIRLIGIDTPEIRNYAKKKKGYYGEEAKSYLASLILNQKVKLEYDLDKYDQHNRVLAYVYLDDTFINAELEKNGFARIMTIQPNSKYSDMFYELQVDARENNLGLWKVEEY